MHKNDLKAYFTEETVGELLAWYRVNRRALPWRETTDPYRIWLSEIMLQQTRVEAVKPYYACFFGGGTDRPLSEKRKTPTPLFQRAYRWYNIKGMICQYF